MSRYNYAPIMASAKRLINRFGAEVNVTATSTVPNPQGWKPPVKGSQTVTLDAVSVEYEEKFIDGSQIKRGDKKFLIAAKGVELDPDMTGWIVDGNNQRWGIVKVKTLVPGSDKILYTVQVRQ